MELTKLKDIIKDDVKMTSFITNISSGYLDIPYIMEETLKMLSDNSPFFNMITDTNKIALCNMLDMYFSDCWQIYIDNIAFDKLLNYGKIEVYKIEALNGLRYATTNEVANGVKGLIGENIYPAGEEEYKNLCLLYWTFTGKNYYFRQAGYQLEYDSNGKVTTPLYAMILMSANHLKSMMAWISDKEQFNKAIKKIEKMKKSKGYKYASFEKDEITEDITIKQLVYNIYTVFPRNSNNQEYRRALALSIKAYKDKKILSPLEVSQLRDTYFKYACDRGKNNRTDNNVQNKLKEECELILKERYSGKIPINHFAFTIIQSLQKSNYSKCSDRQYSYIKNALECVNKGKPEPEENKKTEIITDVDIDNSLESISDAIGNGLFDDMEDD